MGLRNMETKYHIQTSCHGLKTLTTKGFGCYYRCSLSVISSFYLLRTNPDRHVLSAQQSVRHICLRLEAAS